MQSLYRSKSPKNVDNSGESDIIEESNKKAITPITDSSIERVPNVKISGYTDEQCSIIQQQHKEYFGIDRNGNPPAYFQNDYVASIQWKRELHKTNATTMIETFAFENFEGVLTSELENKLKEKNVSFAPMSQEELWRKITEDNKNVLDGLIQLIETVINLMKSNRYDIDVSKNQDSYLS